MSNMPGSLRLFRIRLATFLQWWKATLLDVLPGALIELVAGDLRRVRTFSSLETASLMDYRQKELLKVVWEKSENRWQSDKAWKRIAAVMSTCPVELYLTESELLRQEVRLPHAALENLSGVVRNGLSTWSPFSPDDVLVAAVHLGSDEQTSVELRYAVRETIDLIISKAAAQGLHVDRVVLGDDRWRVAVGRKTTRIKRRRWIDGALVLSAILLAGIFLETTWIQQSAIHERIEHALQKEIAFARKQSELENALLHGSEFRSLVSEEKQTSTSASQLLASIAGLLPADAVIAGLEFDQKQGLLTIEHRTSNDLATILSRSPLLKDVQLRQSGTEFSPSSGLPGGVAQSFAFRLAARGGR